MGTTWSANTATNNQSLPGNLIHANAYAASVARKIGSSTDGTVITSELRMNGASDCEFEVSRIVR